MARPQLGLEDCQKTPIGSVEHRGVSGGQRKRVSIGMEMITDPSVLFLDEPTSGTSILCCLPLLEARPIRMRCVYFAFAFAGLDSSTAYILVETLKKLALMGRTIVSTIHQPR